MDVRLTGGYVWFLCVFLRHIDSCALLLRCAQAAACVDGTAGKNLLRRFCGFQDCPPPSLSLSTSNSTTYHSVAVKSQVSFLNSAVRARQGQSGSAIGLLRVFSNTPFTRTHAYTRTLTDWGLGVAFVPPCNNYTKWIGICSIPPPVSDEVVQEALQRRSSSLHAGTNPCLHIASPLLRCLAGFNRSQ